MKKLVLLLILTLCSFGSYAQNKEEKIKTLKIAYITEKLSLTKSEAEKFWPVYNAFEQNNNELRMDIRTKRESTNVEDISESEAKSVLASMLKMHDERHLLFTQYIKDLQKILPAKKIIMLKKAEDDFKVKMFEEYKKRHHGNMNRQGS